MGNVPKIYAMRQDELTDFVHDIAIPGDIAYSRDNAGRSLMYFCTTENIGKDINPFWTIIDGRAMLRERIKNMTIEEKIDFIIDRLI